MRKYGFEYLVEKVQVLNEMAKGRVYPPMSQDATTDDVKKALMEFDNIYGKVHEIMKHEGGNTARIIFDYLITTYYAYAKKQPTPSGAVWARSKNFVKQNTEDYLEWVATYKTKSKGGSKKETSTNPLSIGNYIKDYYLTHLIKQYPNVVFSDSFRKKILDPSNIKQFVNNPGGYDASGQSIIADIAKNRKEQLYGRDLGDIFQIEAQARPLLVQINRLMRKKRKENWNIEDEKATPEVHLSKELAEELSYIVPFTDKGFQNSSSDTENKGGSLFAKREMDDEKTSNPRKYFGEKFTEKEILQLIGFLESREESGLGITEAQWLNLISKMKTSNPLISELGEYLLSVAKREKKQNIDESGEFEGYDKEALAQVLNTPEKEDIFRSFYELRQAEADKQSEIEEKRFIAAARKYEKAQQSSLGMGIEGQIEKLMLKAEESDNPSEIKSIKRKIEALQRKREQPEDEEGVMGYFSEQILKDRHTNVIGEFKERGYKKFKNYNHWLSTNQEI